MFKFNRLTKMLLQFKSEVTENIPPHALLLFTRCDYCAHTNLLMQYARSEGEKKVYLLPSGCVITMSKSPQEAFPRLYDPPHITTTFSRYIKINEGPDNYTYA